MKKFSRFKEIVLGILYLVFGLMPIMIVVLFSYGGYVATVEAEQEIKLIEETYLSDKALILDSAKEVITSFKDETNTIKKDLITAKDEMNSIKKMIANDTKRHFICRVRGAWFTVGIEHLFCVAVISSYAHYSIFFNNRAYDFF